MERSPLRRPGLLAVGLFLAGLALVSWDVRRWWRANHPVDDGGYGPRPDWSEPSGGVAHFFGYAYRDRDRNGRRDPDDPPMAGVAMEMTAPGGAKSIFRTNLAGFANANMSRADADAPVHEPGEYRFRVLVPPGFAVTTGNVEQTGRVELLPGAPADLVPTRRLAPVGLAPDLSISGRLHGRGPDGALLPARAAKLFATGPDGARRGVPVSADGAFRFPAEPGTWRLEAASEAFPSAIEREVAVRDAPVVVAGLVVGEPGGTTSGRRLRIPFDDVTGASVGKIGFGSALDGLDWGDLHVIRAEEGEGAGYVNVLASGTYVAYSSVPVVLARAGGFDLLGAYFAAAHRESEGETLRVRAFRGNRLVADDDLSLSAMGPAWLDAGFLGVDRVELATRHGWQFALDDLELSGGAPRP